MNLIFNFMNKKFFYYYLAVHLVVFSFILGLVVNAFTVLSGGAISVIPVSDERAVIGNGTIDSYIANATSTAYLKQAKRVAGGCEKWESGVYYRLKTWGGATSTYNGVPDTADCYCPDGFSKILIRTSTSSVQNVHNPAGEWRSHYYDTYSPDPYHLCGEQADTATHPLLSSGNSSCYIYPCCPPKCCCDCADSIEEERYYQESLSLKNDLQKSSLFSQILHNYLFPNVLAGDAKAHGCGLVILHPSNNDLFRPITTNNSTWLCVNTSTTSTVTGWDN